MPTPKLFLALVPVVAALVWPAQQASFKRHVDVLQKAKGVQVKFKVIQIGGGIDEESLDLSRRGALRWDTPTRLVVSDGKTIRDYSKTNRSYTEIDYTEAALLAKLNSDAVWAWKAFYDAKMAGRIIGERAGTSRTVRGVSMTDLVVSRRDALPITLMIDDKTGVARGANFKTERGQDVVVQTTEFTLKEDDLGEGLFAWTPPEGAKKLEVSAQKVTYDQVAEILESNCVRCHGGEKISGGVNLASYEDLMRSRVVVAGDPSASRMIRMIKTGKMPPDGKLDQELIDKLEQWVVDGCLDAPGE